MAVATNPVKVELTNNDGFPRRYTCASGTAIAKGAILTLSDPRTAATVSDTPSDAGYAFAGIASMDKEAADASTSIAAWTSGIFEIRASGAITVGKAVKSCGAGECKATNANDTASGAIMGYALETAADQEVINVAVNI